MLPTPGAAAQVLRVAEKDIRKRQQKKEGKKKGGWLQGLLAIRHSRCRPGAGQQQLSRVLVGCALLDALSCFGAARRPHMSLCLRRQNAELLYAPRCTPASRLEQ